MTSETQASRIASEVVEEMVAAERMEYIKSLSGRDLSSFQPQNEIEAKFAAIQLIVAIEEVERKIAVRELGVPVEERDAYFHDTHKKMLFIISTFRRHYHEIERDWGLGRISVIDFSNYLKARQKIEKKQAKFDAIRQRHNELVAASNADSANHKKLFVALTSLVLALLHELKECRGSAAKPMRAEQELVDRAKVLSERLIPGCLNKPNSDSP